MAKYILIDDHRLVERVEAFQEKYGLPTFEAALRLLYKDKHLMREFMENKK